LIDQPNTGRGDTRGQIIEAAQKLFFEQGYAATTMAQIRTAAKAHSGSLYHFFPSKEELLIAVLDDYKETLDRQVLEPAIQQESDPIRRMFAILDAYRKLLRSSNFRLGCPIGSLALEVSNEYPDVQRKILEVFEMLCEAIEELIGEVSDRLPAKTKPATLARHVLATMEGGIILARAYRSLEPFDQAINHLKDYFDRLLKDRAKSETK
jgi:TetR/AcrR family transcriptional repressor of nem operon